MTRNIALLLTNPPPLYFFSDVPLRDMLWMGALKAGSRMRWMDMFTAEEAHVDPAALLIIRTEADVRALVPLVS